MDDALEDLLLDGLGHDGRRRVGAHAAGILAQVAVEGALVVLGGRERHDAVRRRVIA